MVCLSCLSPLASKDSNATDRVCLSAEGFGNRMCSLEGISNKVRLHVICLSCSLVVCCNGIAC